MAKARHTINLALQGGGSHGAFAWGVLDRLLEDDGVDIDGISGTSAGAMNAAVLASGLVLGGRAGARAALRSFWETVSRIAIASPLQPTPLDAWLGRWNIDSSPAYVFMDVMSRLVSPYQANPFGLNPLADVLDETIDFACLTRPEAIRLFICATNVRSGNIKIFENAELSSQALLASACLPYLFQAVEVDGEHYWDGGYMGNPALFPLIERCGAQDIVIVQINPIRDSDVPKDARHIMDRANEIGFNATLIRELRSIELINKLSRGGSLSAGARHLKHMKIHMIEDEALMAELGFSSKLNAAWDFLFFLFDHGRRVADAWLVDHRDDLGVRSTWQAKREQA